ncbi:MAG: hypothetical protein EBS53_17090, partial [Bacteroidetes bacterium]|nr:hypothetical protein [Bacteroidota bacterium]
MPKLHEIPYQQKNATDRWLKRPTSNSSADTIAQHVGIEKTSLIRARAGISYALTKAMDDGHCGLPEEKLVASARELLDIPQELVSQALALELNEENVIKEVIDQTS